MSELPLRLHVWPGCWSLPSIDAACLEAILYLQLTFPKSYCIVETADPDLSPNGQLPFLTHGQLTVASVSSIVSYLAGLDPSLLAQTEADNDYEEKEPYKTNLNAGLSGLHVSQAAAWRAYVEAQLGDLVTHSFFVLDPNYRTFTHGLLASMLPVPQRYYVPRRIKEAHRPRLEAVGLWQVANEPEESEESGGVKNRARGDKDQKIRHAFGQAKLIEKARLVLDILSRLLDEKPFIFHDRPTAVDLALASRILLLTQAPLPNSALKDMLQSSYPALTGHASRVHALAFPSTSNAQPLILFPAPVDPFSVLKSTLIHLGRGVMPTHDESEEAKRYRRYRWGWIGLAFIGIVGFSLANGLVRIMTPVEQPEGAFEEAEDDAEAINEDEL